MNLSASLVHLLCGLALAASVWAPRANADDLQKTVLVTGCENPMQLEVLADGRILYAERGGKVKLWSPGAPESAVVWSRDVEARNNSATPATGGAWEAGLLGLAVDPAFDRNHWVYLYYSPKAGSEFRVSRLTLTGTPPQLTDEKTLLTVPRRIPRNPSTCPPTTPALRNFLQRNRPGCIIRRDPHPAFLSSAVAVDPPPPVRCITSTPSSHLIASFPPNSTTPSSFTNGCETGSSP